MLTHAMAALAATLDEDDGWAFRFRRVDVAVALCGSETP